MARTGNPPCIRDYERLWNENKRSCVAIWRSGWVLYYGRLPLQQCAPSRSAERDLPSSQLEDDYECWHELCNQVSRINFQMPFLCTWASPSYSYCMTSPGLASRGCTKASCGPQRGSPALVRRKPSRARTQLTPHDATNQRVLTEAQTMRRKKNLLPITVRSNAK